MKQDASPSPSSDSHQKELIRGGISAFSLRLVGMVFNWVFAVMVARSTGAAGTGIYNLVQTVLNFSGTLSKLGADTLMTRFGVQYFMQRQWGNIKDLFNKNLLMSVPLALGLSALIFFEADLIAARIFAKPELAPYFRMGSFALLPLTVFQIATGGIRGLKKIRHYAFLHNVSNFLFGILILGGILLFSSNRDPEIVVVTYTAFITLTALLSLYWFIVYSHYLEARPSEGIGFREKFWIGISLFVASLASLVRGYADTLILSRYASMEEVGIYRNAFKVATVTRIALVAMLIPAAPKFAELFAAGKMDELRRSAQYVTKIIFWCSAPILLVIILAAPLIMGIFGKEFVAGSTVLMVLAFGQFINAATGPVSNILIMTGRQKLNRNLMVATTVLAILLNLWLIPVLGALGAALVNTLGVFILNVIPFFLIRRFYGFYTLDVRDLFRIRPKQLLQDIREALRRDRKRKSEDADDDANSLGE
ncbi:MAG: flippase [Chitinophagales bacterium]|nr:flippase [Chitinophagales bacterium]MDW8393574.1 flippase [Chitinophagales bacterium]